MRILPRTKRLFELLQVVRRNVDRGQIGYVGALIILKESCAEVDLTGVEPFDGSNDALCVFPRPRIRRVKVVSNPPTQNTWIVPVAQYHLAGGLLGEDLDCLASQQLARNIPHG